MSVAVRDSRSGPFRIQLELTSPPPSITLTTTYTSTFTSFAPPDAPLDLRDATCPLSGRVNLDPARLRATSSLVELVELNLAISSPPFVFLVYLPPRKTSRRLYVAYSFRYGHIRPR